MAPTTPRTWTDGELVTASIMNTNVRDNFNYVLNERAYDNLYDASAAAAYTTTSTSDVLINAVFQHVFTVYFTRVQFWFTGSLSITGAGANTGIVSLYVDGVLTREVCRLNTAGTFAATDILTGITPGSRTIDLRWRVTAGTMTLNRGGNNFSPISWILLEV